jgi:hypothetical protein
LAGVALASITAAWLSGARFVATTSNGASLAMALAAGTAILCYTLILFITPRLNGRRREKPAMALPRG